MKAVNQCTIYMFKATTNLNNLRSQQIWTRVSWAWYQRFHPITHN